MDTLVLNADCAPLTYVPLSVVPWQAAIKLIYTDKATVLKTYDDWVVRSQHLALNVPSIVMTTEYVRWDRGVKYNRVNIYARDSFQCQLQITHACKKVNGHVRLSDLTIDHVVPRSLGGKSVWQNVSTSCKHCNWEKGNDASIVPAVMPHKPTYHEVVARRKLQPLYVREESWLDYIDWPKDRVIVTSNARLVDNAGTVISKL